MLARSLRTQVSIALMVFFCLCLLWTINHSQKPQQHQQQSTKNPVPETATKVSNIAEEKQRIAIVTFVTYEKSYIHMSLRNKDYYARRHGYDFVVDYDSKSERGTTWLKFDMVERLIKAGKHDWIWWTDFDTLITNTTVKLYDIIKESLASASNPDEINFLLTDDCNGLNDGSFIARSHPKSIEFLNRVRALHDREIAADKDKQLNDQESMRDFLETNDPYVNTTMTIPQWKINAFPEEIGCYDDRKTQWAYGMFVIHFAGAWAHVQGDDPTGQMMRKYEPQIIWGDDE